MSSPGDAIDAIEEAFVTQWAHFGQGPGGTFHDDDDVIWVEAPVHELPYNSVLRTRISDDAEQRVSSIVNHFRQRGVEFMWLVHPTAEPEDLDVLLSSKGLTCVERATGMSLDLGRWDTPNPRRSGLVSFREVTDERGLTAFESLIAEYWELSQQSSPYVFDVNRSAHERNDGARWVAYRDEVPIAKAYLSYLGRAGAMAIFGVYVRPDARGQGIARTLMEIAIDRAAQLGASQVVLHSSEMAIDLYRSMGFVERCVLPVYATTDLHGAQPL